MCECVRVWVCLYMLFSVHDKVWLVQMWIHINSRQNSGMECHFRWNETHTAHNRLYCHHVCTNTRWNRILVVCMCDVCELKRMQIEVLAKSHTIHTFYVDTLKCQPTQGEKPNRTEPNKANRWSVHVQCRESGSVNENKHCSSSNNNKRLKLRKIMCEFSHKLGEHHYCHLYVCVRVSDFNCIHLQGKFQQKAQVSISATINKICQTNFAVSFFNNDVAMTSCRTEFAFDFVIYFLPKLTHAIYDFY